MLGFFIELIKFIFGLVVFTGLLLAVIALTKEIHRPW